nr:hypothetical protein Iba_chr02bCG14600 [Ipomoea batatas]
MMISFSKEIVYHKGKKKDSFSKDAYANQEVNESNIAVCDISSSSLLDSSSYFEANLADLRVLYTGRTEVFSFTCLLRLVSRVPGVFGRSFFSFKVCSPSCSVSTHSFSKLSIFELTEVVAALLLAVGRIAARLLVRGALDIISDFSGDSRDEFAISDSDGFMTSSIPSTLRELTNSRALRALAMATLVMLAGILFTLQRAWSSLLVRVWKSMDENRDRSDLLGFGALLLGLASCYNEDEEQRARIKSYI